MKCIRIGYGHIAYWHEKKLSQLGVKTVGIIEKDADKNLLAKSHGFHVLAGYEEAIKFNPTFWDICTCTASHVATIEKIVQISPDANILVEKPICLLSQLDELKNVLKPFRGRIIVNENYQVSQVTKVVREQINQLGLEPTRIISEMTKNRSNDIAKGRFLDEEHFAFGYEGSHLIANVLTLGKDYAPTISCGVTYQGMYVSYPTYKKYLPKQGSVKKCYLSNNDTEVTLYTSMEGKIGFLFPHSPYNNNNIPAEDYYTRYRVLAVKDEVRNLTVVGYYEPVVNLPRTMGMVMVLENDQLKECISPIEDDTMQLFMNQAVDYFNDKGENPGTLSQAIDIVEMFNLWQNQGESYVYR